MRINLAHVDLLAGHMRVDWNRIETVLLDMDGTLLDLGFDNFFWREHVPRVYARMHGISLVRARETLEPLYREREGSLQWYCIDYWSEVLEMDIAELKHELRHRIAIRPGVPEFLDRLGREGRDVRLVTNAHRKVIDLKLRESRLGPCFNDVVSSHDIGSPKEDVRFWRGLCRLRSFDPARALLLDDSVPVLEAAHDFGIGCLRAIRLPDLSASPSTNRRFPAIDSFSELHDDSG